MTIIHVANIDPSILGGVQVAVPQMVRAQSRYANVALMNTHGGYIPDVHGIHYDGESFSITELEPPFNFPDLIVFHELYRFEYIKLYKHFRNAGIPYIIVPHGGMAKQAQKRKLLKKAVANVLFFNSFVHHAAAIQYLTESEVRRSIFRKKYIVSGNGVSLPSKKKSFFSSETIKMVYIGRLEIETKGLDLLLEAVKCCEEMMRQHRVNITIYGPSYCEEGLWLKERIRENRIEDLICVKKAVRGKEKEDILLSADYFIQTSRTEGLPMGILEAMSYGLPCLVTEGTGLGSAISVSKAGYSAETSTEGVATLLCTAVEAREKLGIFSQNARRLIVDHYECGEIAREAIEKYRTLI